MNVTFQSRMGGEYAPLHYFLFLAGCNADIAAGALATTSHHEVGAMFEIGARVREKEPGFLRVAELP